MGLPPRTLRHASAVTPPTVPCQAATSGAARGSKGARCRACACIGTTVATGAPVAISRMGTRGPKGRPACPLRRGGGTRTPPLRRYGPLTPLAASLGSRPLTSPAPVAGPTTPRVRGGTVASAIGTATGPRGAGPLLSAFCLGGAKGALVMWVPSSRSTAIQMGDVEFGQLRPQVLG